MKKYISLFLAVLICLGLCACSTQATPGNDSGTSDLRDLLSGISDQLTDLGREEAGIQKPSKPLEGTYHWDEYTIYDQDFVFHADGTCEWYDNYNHYFRNGYYIVTETGWRLFFGTGIDADGFFFDAVADGEDLIITGFIGNRTNRYTKQ